MAEEKKMKDKFSTISLLLSAVGLVIAVVYLFTAALILAIISKSKKEKSSNIALILSIIGLIISAILVFNALNEASKVSENQLAIFNKIEVGTSCKEAVTKLGKPLYSGKDIVGADTFENYGYSSFSFGCFDGYISSKSTHS